MTPGQATIPRLCVGILAALALAACGDGNGDTLSPSELRELGELVEAAPSCDDLFAPGRPTEDVLDDTGVTDAEGGGVCDQGTDELLLTVMASLPCDSDPSRELHYPLDTEAGYGYGADAGTWQPHIDGMERPPTDIC